jgi:FkbM family methyltransferase
MATDRIERPLSYAQNMEDYHLSLAFDGTERGFYIDIGGGHPIAGSVSFWLYERGWRGLVVEPQTDLVSLHRQLRPRDTIVNAVVSQLSGETEFYRVDRLHALSTLLKENAQAASAHGVGFSSVRVRSFSLADLCRLHNPAAIDFLKIDVEGAEREVIAGGDWQRYRPKVVVVEAIAPTRGTPAWENWEPLLTANGYKFVLFDTLNRFYVAEEQTDLLAKIPFDRQPWDRVRHMYEIGRAPDNALHPDHALAKELAQGFWASLPHLGDDLVLSLLRRGRGLSEMSATDRESDKLEERVRTEPFRFSLGRIACNYDGGFVSED